MDVCLYVVLIMYLTINILVFNVPFSVFSNTIEIQNYVCLETIANKKCDTWNDSDTIVSKQDESFFFAAPA